MTDKKKIIQPMVLFCSRSVLKGTQIYSVGDSKFKIELNSDGYLSQSYVRLSKWTEYKGFEIITTQNVIPYFKEFQNVHIGHNAELSNESKSFKLKAISDMEKIAKNFF